MNFVCPVCGYPYLMEIPWSEQELASYDICPSCGIEFGYDDDQYACGHPGTREELQEQWRDEWVKWGMRWFSRQVSPPPNWDPVKQLASIGVEYYLANLKR
jgi:hypothetical protein